MTVLYVPRSLDNGLDIEEAAALREVQGSTSDQKENNLVGFRGFHHRPKAGIWP